MGDVSIMDKGDILTLVRQPHYARLHCCVRMSYSSSPEILSHYHLFRGVGWLRKQVGRFCSRTLATSWELRIHSLTICVPLLRLACGLPVLSI